MTDPALAPEPTDPLEPTGLAELLTALEARPLDDRAGGYLDVLERLRGRLEDPSPER